MQRARKRNTKEGVKNDNYKLGKHERGARGGEALMVADAIRRSHWQLTSASLKNRDGPIFLFFAGLD